MGTHPGRGVVPPGGGSCRTVAPPWMRGLRPPERARQRALQLPDRSSMHRSKCKDASSCFIWFNLRSLIEERSGSQNTPFYTLYMKNGWNVMFTALFMDLAQ